MATDESKWYQAIPAGLIHSDEVHIWRVDLDSVALQGEGLFRNLSADEVTRAERFHFEKDQRRFIASRGILRQLLGRYLEKKPHTLQFEYTSHGKPVLAPNSGFGILRFNLSHTDTLALYAITRSRNIGIDVERIRNDVAFKQIAQRFFSLNERHTFEKIHESNQPAEFFKYWTRKEAFLKAAGEGLSFPMELCDVSLINENVLSPFTLLRDDGENFRLYGKDLFPGCGYAAAIAIEGDDCDISCWQYSEQGKTIMCCKISGEPRNNKFKTDEEYAFLHLESGRHYGLMVQDVEAILLNLITVK